MVTCPLEPCPKDGVEFGSDHALVMHMLNTPKHTQVTSKREAYDVLNGESSAGVNDSPSEETESAQEPTESVSTESDGGSSGQKLDFGKLTGDDDEQEPETGCPSCGEDDYFAASDILAEHAAKLDSDEIDALRSHDRVCTDCGECYDG